MTKYHIELAYTHAAAIDLNHKYDLVENPLFAHSRNNVFSLDLDLQDKIKELTGGNINNYWLFYIAFYFNVLVIECYVMPYEEAQLYIFVTEEKENAN